MKCSSLKEGPALHLLLGSGEGNVQCAGQLEHVHVRVQAPGHVALAHRQACHLGQYTSLEHIFYNGKTSIPLKLKEKRGYEKF